MKLFVMFDPGRVKPFADQPRKRFRGIKQLAESIRLVGQVTPIVVTPYRENGFDAELIDGERRLQACRLSNLRIKAVIEDCASPADRCGSGTYCRGTTADRAQAAHGLDASTTGAVSHFALTGGRVGG